MTLAEVETEQLIIYYWYLVRLILDTARTIQYEYLVPTLEDMYSRHHIQFCSLFKNAIFIIE